MLTIFAKKVHPRLLMVLNMAHGNTVKKIFILKIFPQLCKTFCLCSYHVYFILSQKSEKHVTERNKRLSLWSLFTYSLTKEISSWFPRIGSVKVTCVRSCAQFLNFYERERVWIFFLQHVLPKLSKITVTCPKSLKKPNMVNFDLPKVSKIIISLELLKVRKMTSWKMYISCHREAGNIKFQIWIPDKHHWKGSVGYSASDGSDVISS